MTMPPDEAARGPAKTNGLRLLHAIVVVLMSVLLMALLEGGARVFWSPKVRPSHVGVIAEGTERAITHEGITYRTNKEGIRSPDVPPRVDALECRILALGDSFVWGDGISEEALVTTKMKQELSSRFPKVLVINAGISGHNTSDEYRQLERLAPIYDPDHVIVFFFTNDLLTRDTTAAGAVRTTSRRQMIKEWLRKRSAFFAWMYCEYKSHLAARMGVPKSLLPQDYFRFDETNAGWAAFREALAGIRSYCASRGLGLQFVIIPTLTSLGDNYPYSYMHGRVKSFAEELGLSVIDLRETYRPYEPEDLWVSRENSHWNEFATTIAAREIAHQIPDAGLLRRSPGVTTIPPEDPTRVREASGPGA